MRLTDIEASFNRFLYESFETRQTDPIKVFENINFDDFSNTNKWIVIESLTSTLGAEPKSFYFLHICVQKGLKNEKTVLTRLVDDVLSVVNNGTQVDVYNYDTGVRIGCMEVSETSLSPVLQHLGGGGFRTLTVGVVYEGS